MENSKSMNYAEQFLEAMEIIANKAIAGSDKTVLMEISKVPEIGSNEYMAKYENQEYQVISDKTSFDIGDLVYVTCPGGVSGTNPKLIVGAVGKATISGVELKTYEDMYSKYIIAYGSVPGDGTLSNSSFQEVTSTGEKIGDGTETNEQREKEWIAHVNLMHGIFICADFTTNFKQESLSAPELCNCNFGIRFSLKDINGKIHEYSFDVNHMEDYPYLQNNKQQVFYQKIDKDIIFDKDEPVNWEIFLKDAPSIGDQITIKNIQFGAFYNRANHKDSSLEILSSKDSLTLTSGLQSSENQIILNAVLFTDNGNVNDYTFKWYKEAYDGYREIDSGNRLIITEKKARASINKFKCIAFLNGVKEAESNVIEIINSNPTIYEVTSNRSSTNVDQWILNCSIISNEPYSFDSISYTWKKKLSSGDIINIPENDSPSLTIDGTQISSSDTFICEVAESGIYNGMDKENLLQLIYTYNRSVFEFAAGNSAEVAPVSGWKPTVDGTGWGENKIYLWKRETIYVIALGVEKAQNTSAPYITSIYQDIEGIVNETKFLRLNTDQYAFIKNGTEEENIITLVAERIGFVSMDDIEWTIIDDENNQLYPGAVEVEGIELMSGGTLKLSSEILNNFTRKFIKVTAAEDGLFDTIQIGQIEQGSNAWNIIVTNPVMGFNVNGQPATEQSYIYVYRGSEKLKLKSSENSDRFSYTVGGINPSTGAAISSVNGAPLITISNPQVAKTYSVQVTFYDMNKVLETNQIFIYCHMVENGESSYSLSLDNDSDVLVRDTQGRWISSFPVVVTATAYIGDTAQSNPKISITSSKTGSIKGVSANNGVLTITDQYEETSDTLFTFKWKKDDSDTIGYDTKIFTLRTTTSLVDYCLVLSKSVVNVSNGPEDMLVQVQAKDNNGTKNLTGKEIKNAKLSLYVNGDLEADPDDTDSGWTLYINTDTNIMLKDEKGFKWDEETIEVVENGEDGDPGESAYKVSLNKTYISIPCDNVGNPVSPENITITAIANCGSEPIIWTTARSTQSPYILVSGTGLANGITWAEGVVDKKVVFNTGVSTSGDVGQITFSLYNTAPNNNSDGILLDTAEVTIGKQKNGRNGEDGASVEYVYYRSDVEVTSWNGKAPNNEEQNGWTNSPRGITQDNPYEYMSVRTKTVNDNKEWTAFSDPIVWSRWGEKGADGDGVEYKYCLIRSTTEPTTKPLYPAPSGVSYAWTDEPTGITASARFEYVAVITKKHNDSGEEITTTSVALWSKYSVDGESARDLNLLADGYFFVKKKDGTVEPEEINFTTQSSGLTEEDYTWSNTDDDDSTASSNVLSYNDEGTYPITVTVSRGGLTDSVTIGYIEEAQDGEDAIGIMLTNPSMTFNSKTSTSETCSAIVMSGTTSASYSSTVPTSGSDWKYTLSGYDSIDSDGVMTINKPSANIVKNITITVYKGKDKKKEQTIGIQCTIVDDGLAAKDFNITADSYIFAEDVNGAISGEIIFTAVPKNLSSPTYKWTDNSTGNTYKLTAASFGTAKSKTISCSCYENGSTTPFGSDSITIYRVPKGTTGPQGEAALTIGLTNGNMTFNVADTTATEKTSVIAYSGSTQINYTTNPTSTGGWQYKIIENSGYIAVTTSGNNAGQITVTNPVTAGENTTLSITIEIYYNRSKKTSKDLEINCSPVQNGTSSTAEQKYVYKGFAQNAYPTTPPDAPVYSAENDGSGWSITEPNSYYIFRSEQTVIDNKIDSTKWSKPILIKENGAVISSERAQFLSLTNGGESLGTFEKFGEDGEVEYLGINASYIKSGALEVSENENLIFRASIGGEDIDGNKISPELYLGGFQVKGFGKDNGAIYKTKTSIDDGNQGVYVGTDGIALGAGSPFRVTESGEGEMAGWTISKTMLFSENLALLGTVPKDINKDYYQYDSLLNPGQKSKIVLSTGAISNLGFVSVGEKDIEGTSEDMNAQTLHYSLGLEKDAEFIVYAYAPDGWSENPPPNNRVNVTQEFKWSNYYEDYYATFNKTIDGEEHFVNGHGYVGELKIVCEYKNTNRSYMLLDDGSCYCKVLSFIGLKDNTYFDISKDGIIFQETLRDYAKEKKYFQTVKMVSDGLRFSLPNTTQSSVTIGTEKTYIKWGVDSNGKEYAEFHGNWNFVTKTEEE